MGGGLKPGRWLALFVMTLGFVTHGRMPMPAFAQDAPPPPATETALPPTPETGAIAESTPSVTATQSLPATRLPMVRGTRTPTPTPVYFGPITAIGDSVMLGAARELQRAIADIRVDAGKSRQMREAIRITSALSNTDTLSNIVIVHIGNNGPIDATLFDQLMLPLRNTRLVLIVNLKVPRPWEARNNAVLAAGVARYPNAVLMDWHGTIETQLNLLAADGTHMGGRSARLYTDMVIGLLSQQSTLTSTSGYTSAPASTAIALGPDPTPTVVATPEPTPDNLPVQ